MSRVENQKLVTEKLSRQESDAAVNKRLLVYQAINDERLYQDHKWGTVEEHPHEVGSWLTIMRQLLNDAEKEYVSERGDRGALDELRKVVSVGVACMEQHGAILRPEISFFAAGIRPLEDV